MNLTSTSYALAPLLLGFPVAGALILLLGGRRTDRFGHVVGTLASAAAFVVAVLVWLQMAGRDETDRGVTQKLWTFAHTGNFTVDMGLRIDQLSIVFALLITGVGTLIHVYSIAYLDHDQNRRRFFGYLNLFVAAMLLLVLASDYLLVYVGWEGVGLASYLLIGFWSHNPPYATAAKKAFVANRVGDIGMSLAIVLMFVTFGATDFARVLPAVHSASEGRLTTIGLLLLLAACGKSAQLPLQSWLGDAMAGPTPVSALIHAATMVTAGVYLIVRSGPIFDGAPDARLVVTVVGAATLVFGALIGTAKDDVKKALAASTMSQIGYMVLAAGLGPAGYAIAIFHLLTHGFFKAGLFLGAGSVMHAMGDRTDMRRFGGLWRVMPVTAVTFGLGYLAIIGCPPFSGFWSKDKIIEAAFDKGGTSGWILGIVALLGAGITAFYMTRVMVMTFFGPRRWRDDVHPHEAPALMTAPMIVLALGSTFLGGVLAFGGNLQHWLEPAVGRSVEVGAHTISPIVLTALTLLVVLGGAAGAFVRYGRADVPLTAPVAGPFTVAARNDLYQDALNEAVLMRPGQYVTRSLVYGDVRGIDGVVNGLAAVLGGTSGRLRRLQTGFVRSYALSVLGGAVLLAGALLIGRV